MVLIASFKSSSIQHGVHFVNGPIYFKIDDKAGYALGRGHFVIDRSIPERAVMTCSVSSGTKRHSKESASSKYSNLCFKPAFQ